MQTTPRWGTRTPDLSVDSPDVPLWMRNLAMDLDDVAKDDQGLIADRPVSTAGSPGKRGRYYYATDANGGYGGLYRDNGTGWDEIPVGVGQAAVPGDYKMGVQSTSHGLLPDGTHFAWLVCDGSEVDAYYTALIAALSGNPFGVGPGGRPKLPDFQGRVPVHPGTHTSVDALGDSDGTALANRTPKHWHDADSLTANLLSTNAGGGASTVASRFNANGLSPTYLGGVIDVIGDVGNTAGTQDAPSYLVGGRWFMKT